MNYLVNPWANSLDYWLVNKRVSLLDYLKESWKENLRVNYLGCW